MELGQADQHRGGPLHSDQECRPGVSHQEGSDQHHEGGRDTRGCATGTFTLAEGEIVHTAVFMADAEAIGDLSCPCRRLHQEQRPHHMPPGYHPVWEEPEMTSRLVLAVPLSGLRRVMPTRRTYNYSIKAPLPVKKPLICSYLI